MIFLPWKPRFRYYCSGKWCAAHTKGLGAANGCHGYQCGWNSSGNGFAAAACVGEECGKAAIGDFAAAFCRGTGCGKGASGNFAAAFCIGNECGKDATGRNASLCCVGQNCASSTANRTCDTDDVVVPGINGAVADANMFGEGCYNNIDTTSASWIAFEKECASNHSDSSYTVPANTTCVIDCSTGLHYLFKYAPNH